MDNKEKKSLSLSDQSRCQASNQGSILILTLWVIFLLAMLAVAVGAHIEGRLALARRIEQRTVGYYAARVGVERGIARLLQETNGWDGPGEPWSDCRTDFSNVVSGAGVFSVFYSSERSDGESNVTYGVWDEQSKIDINRAGKELIVALLQVAGGLSSENAARVGEAIDVARMRTAVKFPAMDGRTGWANPHIEPGPLKSVYELRWIKGLSPEVFEKIRWHVTVFGAQRVNLNTADSVVLQSLGRRVGGGGGKAAQSLARKILQFRERGGIFKTIHGDGLAGAMGEETRLTDDERRLLNGMSGRDVTVASDHFRGHSEGWLASAPFSQRRRVDFVWDRKERKFEYWYED